MRVVIQRVSEANVLIDNNESRKINKGLLILLGITEADDSNDLSWLINKILQLRIFSDEQGKMNLSIQDIGGDILIISQFTLYASTRKGNRPSYIKAAKPEKAIPLYEEFVTRLENDTSLIIKTGTFGADMKVSLTNDGPVTIIIDSKTKE